MTNKTAIQRLNSLRLNLSAHPDTEPNLEFSDRISDIDEIIDHLEKTDHISQLEKFQKSFNSTFSDHPTLLPPEDWKLRVKLSQEELDEYRDACKEYDLVEVFDAILDRLFLAYGDAVSHGLQHVLVSGFNEVVRSNMSKLNSEGKPVINGVNCEMDNSRPYGKIMKSESYSEPDLKQFL